MDYDEYTGEAERDAGGNDERASAAGEGGGSESGGEKGTKEEHHRVSGDQLLSKVKEIIREGNVRRISIRSEEGRTILEIPLSLGVVGAFLAPTFAAIGAVAALVTSCSIVVERVDKE